MDESISRYDIPNLRKACEVIREIAASEHGLSFKELQSRSGIPRTTLLRILETLSHQEFVRQRANRSFLLGNELLRIGLQFSDRLDLRERAAPILHRLAQSTRSTSHLAVLSGEKSLIVAVQESPERIQAASKPGFLAELHCSSTGKCFLAFVWKDPVAWFRERSPEAPTENSIREPERFEVELQQIRKSGYAVDDEEYSLGIRCCAAPVRNAAGNVIAAIGITAPGTLFPRSRDAAVAATVVQAALELSQSLGYDPQS